MDRYCIDTMSLWLLDIPNIPELSSTELQQVLSKLANYASNGAYDSISPQDLDRLDTRVGLIQQELHKRNNPNPSLPKDEISRQNIPKQVISERNESSHLPLKKRPGTRGNREQKREKEKERNEQSKHPSPTKIPNKSNNTRESPINPAKDKAKSPGGITLNSSRDEDEGDWSWDEWDDVANDPNNPSSPTDPGILLSNNMMGSENRSEGSESDDDDLYSKAFSVLDQISMSGPNSPNNPNSPNKYIFNSNNPNKPKSPQSHKIKPNTPSSLNSPIKRSLGSSLTTRLNKVNNPNNLNNPNNPDNLF